VTTLVYTMKVNGDFERQAPKMSKMHYKSIIKIVHMTIIGFILF